MMSDIDIPPAALEEGARALWKGGHVMWRDSKDAAHAAFVAMVEAWPGMVNGSTRWPHRREIILPLQQETRDDE